MDPEDLPADNDVPVNLADSLGADAGVAVQCFTLYVPNKDKHDQETGIQRRWVLDAIRLLPKINGGATAIPVEGGWMNEEGKIILEHPVVVYSFVPRPDDFVKNLPRLCAFLHQMGRETNQGEVAFEFDDRFYRIRRFDPRKEGDMTKRIRIAEPAVKRIRPCEPTVCRLTPRPLPRPLATSLVPNTSRAGRGPSPSSAMPELIRRRHSSGGRPGIEGTDFRVKVPVGDREWHCLEAIAESLSAEGFSPSAGQVASVLLSIALRSVTAETEAEADPMNGHAAITRIGRAPAPRSIGRCYAPDRTSFCRSAAVVMLFHIDSWRSDRPGRIQALISRRDTQ